MNRNIACATTLITMLVVLLDCQIASSAVSEINWTDRGWYNEVGFHNPQNTNYIVGDGRGPTCISCFADFRNFFVFNLAGVSQPITSAKLFLEVPSFSSADPSENYELHDVTTSITSLQNGTGGVAAWSDLGTGVVYGSRTMTSSDATKVVNITLNSSAIAAMNANHGLFAMGGSITTLDDMANNETYFGRSDSGTFTSLQITYGVPEPSTLLLLAISAMSLLGYRKSKS